LRKAAGAKADQIDAHLLAKIGRLDLAELCRLEPDSPTVAELKTLTRDQQSLIQTQTRLVNKLTACLKDYYPAALSLFAKVQQRSTLVLLQTYPTPQAVQTASVEEITATLRAGKYTNPTRVAPKIFQELHGPQSLVKQLLLVIEDIASYDKAIHTLFLTHDDQEIWRSLPGASKRLAPRLLAGWGDDRTHYTDATSVQALAGTAPVPFQSGNYAKAHKRFACVTPCTSSPGNRHGRKAGRWLITNANELRAKHKVWLFLLWPMSGCASSIACGGTRPAIRQRRLKRQSWLMRPGDTSPEPETR
jgi:transposase